MRSFITNETPLGKAVSLVTDLVVLNILWVICSLPILTIGPATTALYTAFNARRRGEERMTRAFFKGFKANFCQALIVWILTLILGLFLYTGLTILSNQNQGRTAGLMVFALPLLLYFMIVSYLFPLLAEFHTTLPVLFKNAVLLSIGHFPRSLALTALLLLPFILFFILPDWLLAALFMWIPLGFSLCCYLSCKLLDPVLAPYRPEDVDITDL